MKPNNYFYKILLTASLLANFGDNLIGPFYAVFVKNIGGSILQLGYSVTVFGISTGLLIILIGKISDKINKDLITTLGYFIYAIASLFYLIIDSPWQLFVLQIIFAIGTEFLSEPLSALFSKYIDKEKEGEGWGLSQGGSYIATAVSVFIGTFIVNKFGFNILVIIMFSIQIIATVIQSRIYFLNRKLK